jgi:murein DD-endopeptidase MepM/ murein hydrolase activator NlpD
MSTFVNPVTGRIQAKGETWDKTSFIVTSTFAEHVASGRGPGLDIGQGREGSAVFSMARGTVISALVVRVDHGNLIAGKLTFTGYAHVQSPLIVKVGQAVLGGQKIATVGSTGAPGQPHLHLGLNVGGIEVDAWPYLNAGEDDMLDPNKYRPIATCTVRGGITLYGDPNRQTVVDPTWGTLGTPIENVGLYARPEPTKTATGRSALAPILVDLAGGPTVNLKVCYVGWDAITVVNEESGAEKKGANDAAKAAQTYADSLP